MGSRLSAPRRVLSASGILALCTCLTACGGSDRKVLPERPSSPAVSPLRGSPMPSLAHINGVTNHGKLVRLARVVNHRGPMTLNRFSTPKSVLYVTYICAGSGKLSFGSLFSVEPCNGVAATATLRGQAGDHVIHVDVSPQTEWRVVVERPR
jgi:hypothetical protein